MVSRLRSMVTAVALFTTLAVLLLWVLSLRMQGQLQEQVLNRSELRAQQLADAMGGQVEAQWGLLDLSLQELREHWLNASPDRFDAAVHKVLATFPDGLVSHVTVVDAAGMVVYNSLDQEPGTFVGDRPHFQALRAGGDRLVVGESVKARLTGRWQFVVGRPLLRQGRFVGAVHLLVSTDYLASKLGQLTLSDKDLVALVHPSGRFLARSLDNETAMGLTLPPTRPFLQDHQASKGVFRLSGQIDAVARVYGWCRLPESGAVVVVGLSETSALAPLAGALWQANVLTGVLSLALVAIGIWIGRLLWRVEKGRDAASRSEQRLKAAQQMARVGHWEFDAVQRLLAWSDEVFRIFGRDPVVFQPAWGSFLESVHPDDREALGRAFSTAQAEQRPLDQVIRIVRPDGFERHVRLLCRMDFLDGQVVRHHGTVQDVTELRDAQLALEQLNAGLEHRVKARTDELEALNRDLESFTYSVSHDLRTPLRSIHGFATMLRETEGERLTDEGRDFLRRIQDGARRMGLLITDLLAMSQQNRAELNVQALNLTEMAHAVASDLERSDPSRQVQWHIDSDLHAVADPVLMRAVLQNLLGNAWKYTGQTPWARISFTRVGVEHGLATFCVRDNGAGFDMAYADQLFQPFKRLHHQHQFEGTGVGLAVVQRIVQRHGGRVRGEAAVGQGATFWFSLPLAEVGGPA